MNCEIRGPISDLYLKICIECGLMGFISTLECLEYIGDQAGALSVLKPLTFSDVKNLPEAVDKWETNIRSLKLSERKIETLIDLLIYAILQRFPEIGREEIDKMLELTPLEETAAVKEIIQITMDKGIDKGREEGIDKGELIGKIYMAQRFMRQPLTPREKLVEQSVDDLSAILDMLESELSGLESGSA